MKIIKLESLYRSDSYFVVKVTHQCTNWWSSKNKTNIRHIVVKLHKGIRISMSYAHTGDGVPYKHYGLIDWFYESEKKEHNIDT